MSGPLPVFAYWHSADRGLLGDFLAHWHIHFPELRVLGDADVEPIINRIRPEHVALYRRIRFPAIKADIARLAYLHESGGLYVDCHCALRSVSGVRELLRKLDQFELVLWENTRIARPRPKNTVKPINGIMLARRECSIIRDFLLSGLMNLAAHAKRQASEGLVESDPWSMCGAGNVRTLLTVPDTANTQLRPEFEGRIFFTEVDDGPIAINQHTAYRSDPTQHWNYRRLREPLFEPD